MFDNLADFDACLACHEIDNLFVFSGVCGIADRLLTGGLPQRGFINVEDVTSVLLLSYSRLNS